MRQTLCLALLSLAVYLATAAPASSVGHAGAMHESALAPLSTAPSGHDRYVLPLASVSVQDGEDETLFEPALLSEWNYAPSDVVCNYVTRAQPLGIPDDGTWVSACFSDPRAPHGAVISEISLKYAVDHPARSELEIRLVRKDSTLLQTVWSRGTPAKGSEFGKAPRISAFKGMPGNGEWVFQVRDVVPGNRGKLTDVWFVPTYAASGPQPIQKSGSPGRAGIPSLPVAPRQPASPDRNPQKSNPRKSPKAPTPPRSQGRAPAPRATTSTSWQTVKQETFEGPFPNCGGFPSACWSSSGWTQDLQGIWRQYLWDDDDWWPYSGSWGAWPGAGGADQLDPEWSDYPPNMNSWMFYGPLDLRGATSAEVSFWLWRHTEVDYDKVWFGVWDGSQLLGGSYWDGSFGWEQEVIDLGPFIGLSGIYLTWVFQSDSSFQYSGPWVDDISFTVLPGEVTSRGSLSYVNRSNVVTPTLSINVHLYDWDQSSGVSTWLASTITQSDGSFSFPATMNWDTDSADPDPRLDLYVVWETDSSNGSGTRRVVYGPAFVGLYQWSSEPHYNVGNGTGGSADFYGAGIGQTDPSLPAMWVMQDMNRGRDFVLNHTNPSTEPGPSTAYWGTDVNIFGFCTGGSCFVGGTSPYIFVQDDQVGSQDTALHELGHHYMHTATSGWWYPWPDCYGHSYFTAKNTGCGWSEGWADFFPLAVNNDPCYDFDAGPCSGTPNVNHFNMETHDWQDSCATFACGDTVEGRVAGALWDFYDATNDGYDVINNGFGPIWNKMARNPGLDNFRQFWDNWTADRHLSVQTVFQNSIDYDYAPYWNPQPLMVERNRSITIDLWSYVWDPESLDSQLTFPGATNMNPQCAVTLSTHFLTFTPGVNYMGICGATVDAFDGLETSVGTFYATVTNPRVFLPLISK